jgi:hypothetical protein
MSMFPTKDMRNRLAYMHSRSPDGTIRPRDHLHRLPLVIDPDKEAEARRVFNSGGAGMFAKPQEYCSKSLTSPSISHTSSKQRLKTSHKRYYLCC